MAQRNGSLISLPDFALPENRLPARESSLPPAFKEPIRRPPPALMPVPRSSFGREIASANLAEYYTKKKKSNNISRSRKELPYYHYNPFRRPSVATNDSAGRRSSFMSQLSTTTTVAPERWVMPPRHKRRSRSVDDMTSTISTIYSARRNKANMPYFQRPGPLLAAMAHDYEKQRKHNIDIPYYYPRAMMWRPVAPLPCPPMEQPGGAVANDVLSPIASRSMLTCSKEFRAQFPNVYAGLCKGLLDVNRLVQHEVVVPIKEEIAIHKDAIRSRRAVTAIWSEHLWRPLHGRFPDPTIAPKLIRRLCDYFWNKIEIGIRAAEDERSFLQWLFRFDVENAMDIRVTTTLGAGMNSALVNIEGVAHVKRHKGALMGILRPDTLQLDIDLVVKALFLNGGQLAEINDDPIFIDRVQAGENRFAATFVN